jgi:hypothetical protein
MQKIIILILLLPFGGLFAQEKLTPAEQNRFSKVTSYQELSSFVHELDVASELLRVETIGQSTKGNNLYALKFSTGEFGGDPSKLKVLIFAQQHGNEQSGKEGALLLARELIKPKNSYLFDHIDVALIAQVNPDGSEVNKRRNGNDTDLNRNHLLLTEPETVALHRFFDKYLFEVSMDVHEYSPYGEEWKKTGFRKNTQVTLGTMTNLNVAAELRDFSNNQAIPYLFDYLKKHQYTSFIYCPGDPPGEGYTRHSTFDINDGRQSIGIQNTLSFIQEGMNGSDNYTENLETRSKSQMMGMQGLLEFAYTNHQSILRMVNVNQNKLIEGKSNRSISIQSEHIPNGTSLWLPVYAYATGKDTLIEITDYRPLVRSLTEVEMPLGYLIPDSLPDILAWAERQDLVQVPYFPNQKHQIEQYSIVSLGTIDFEDDTIIDPNTDIHHLNDRTFGAGYTMIPTNQLKGNMIALALEPKSMVGLVTYEQFKHLLQAGKPYPILRLMKK